MAVAIYTTLLTLDEAPSGEVEVQDAGTTSQRNIYTDVALTTLATNPIPLDSAGRSSQGILYTAAGAYKVIVRDSADQTVFTRDNIDPGVPLGTGVLAIANGGTGGATAAAARASLEAVGTADIEALEAQVASLAGALASVEYTAVAKGTTAQRPSSPATGQLRYNTTTGEYEAYQSTWENIILTGDAAAKSDMETATDTAKYITPAQAHNHPGVAKVWAFVTVSGGTPTVTASYNVTSVTDNGVGNYTLNLTTAFSSANFAVIPNLFLSDATIPCFCECTAKTASTITIRTWQSTGSVTTDKVADDNSFFVVAFGDQ